ELGDQFEGYSGTAVAGVRIGGLFDQSRHAPQALSPGQPGSVVLERTPFYLEAGGQVSDVGRIFSAGGLASATVEGMSRLRTGLAGAHRGRVTAGTLQV